VPNLQLNHIMTSTPTHISAIRPGDTVQIDGQLKTVSSGDIRKGFMGTTLWGDSYRLGAVLVLRVHFTTDKP
jgi:hypothetical protein